MNRYRAVFAVCAALLAITIISGCNRGPNKTEDGTSNLADSAQGTQARPLDSNDVSTETTIQREAEGLSEAKGAVKVTLYFGDKEGEYLIAETRQVAQSDSVAKDALEELIKGPKDSSLAATIPQGTKLLDFEVRKGIAYADFSQEFIDNHPGGSSGELMTVNSIVNTLTEFDDIQKVQLLVDSKEVETIAGHMDTSTPLTRDESLIKGAK